MNRRTFLQHSASGLALFGFSLTSIFPLRVHAEPASSLAAVAAFAQLTSGVLSYIGRGANPTVPLLISISNALDAINLRVDTIENKLDLALMDLREIRDNLRITPRITVDLLLIRQLRGHTKAFYELDPLQARPTRNYFDNIHHHFRELRTARAQLTGTAGLSTKEISAPSHVFDPLIDVALAQDSELAMASELLRQEAFDFELNPEPAWLMNGLKDYDAYFSAALDDNRSESIVSQKAEKLKSVNAILDKIVEYKTGISHAVPLGNTSTAHLAPSVESTLREMLERDIVYRICGSKGTVCNVANPKTGFCHEPGDFRYLFSGAQATRKRIVEGIDLADDALNYPFFHSLRRSYTDCMRAEDVELRSLFGHFTKEIDKLNVEVLAYYKLHYVEAVARASLELNREHQRVINDIVQM